MTVASLGSEQRIALITGATSGLGYATALALARLGHGIATARTGPVITPPAKAGGFSEAEATNSPTAATAASQTTHVATHDVIA